LSGEKREKSGENIVFFAADLRRLPGERPQNLGNLDIFGLRQGIGHAIRWICLVIKMIFCSQATEERTLTGFALSAHMGKNLVAGGGFEPPTFGL
jgi:uncharacterized membrane protein